MNAADVIALAIVTICWFFVCMILTVIIHELGHLVGGLTTGYRLSGFAVCGIMFGKRNGKSAVTRYSPSFLNWGQCFMYADDVTKPCGRLVLGGCVINLVAGFILSVMAVITIDLKASSGVWRLMFIAVPALINLIMGMANMFFGTETSDGNTYKETKTADGRKMYNRIMRVTAYLVEGKAFSEMPEDLFKWSGKCSMSEELKMYGYFREFEQCNSIDDLKKSADKYSITKNTKGYFETEKEIESQIAELLIGSRSYKANTAKEPRFARELLLRLIENDNEKMIEIYRKKEPLPGNVRSVELCWDGAKKIMNERKVLSNVC